MTISDSQHARDIADGRCAPGAEFERELLRRLADRVDILERQHDSLLLACRVMHVMMHDGDSVEADAAMRSIPPQALRAELLARGWSLKYTNDDESIHGKFES